MQRSRGYKERVLKASDVDTVVTGASVGHRVRSLRNMFTQEFARMEREGRPPEEVMEFGMGRLARAVREGDVVWGSVMAGQVAGMVRRRVSASHIVNEVVSKPKPSSELWEVTGDGRGLHLPRPGCATHRHGAGCAERVPVARRVFELASEAVGHSMEQLCFEPNDRLDLTVHAARVAYGLDGAA